ncbi:MAG: hypothetical protein ACT4OO_06615 [Nitrospiraceae bacterium]
MDKKLTILHVAGPFREPRDQVFSYDYSIQRVSWSMPHTARVKVAIAEELEYVKGKVLGVTTGSPGQQLVLNQILSRRIADQKLRIADGEGMLSERRDVMIETFIGPWSHLLLKLEAWVKDEEASLRTEIQKRIRL